MGGNIIYNIKLVGLCEVVFESRERFWVEYFILGYLKVCNLFLVRGRLFLWCEIILIFGIVFFFDWNVFF